MKHLRQQFNYDCVPTCVSMLAEIPYEAALALAPPRIRSNGVANKAAAAMLAKVTGKTWSVVAIRPARPLADWTDWPAARCMAVVRRDGLYHGHAVAIEAGLVYDPEFPGPRPIRRYPRRWRLCSIIAEAAEAWMASQGLYQQGDRCKS